jgi:hypothetical protein
MSDTVMLDPAEGTRMPTNEAKTAAAEDRRNKRQREGDKY